MGAEASMQIYRHGIVRIATKHLNNQGTGVQIRQTVLRMFGQLRMTDEIVTQFGEAGTIAATVRYMQSPEYTLKRNAFVLFAAMTSVSKVFNVQLN